MRNSVFISYSSKDSKDISEELYKYLVEEGLKVFKDDVHIKSNQSILDTVPSEIRDVRVFVLVVSEGSLSSDWCAYEVCLFLNRKRLDTGLLFIPILVDDQEVYPPYIACWPTIEAKHPPSFSDKYKEVAERINAPGFLSDSVSIKGLIDDSASYTRFKDMIKQAVQLGLNDFGKLLEEVVGAIHKQQHILTPHSIALKEKSAISEIWVVTTHLYNDTYDDSIMESVRENLKNGIKYKYFIVKTELTKERREMYQSEFDKWQDKYDFIESPESSMILTFDELVLYDPLEVPRLWGYAQIRYPLRGLGEEDDLFLKLSPTNASSIAQNLKVILKNHEKGRHASSEKKESEQ